MSLRLASLWKISVVFPPSLRSSISVTILKLITGWVCGDEEEAVGVEPSVQVWVRLEGGVDQCLQVFLLSGLFSIRSASSLESTENQRFLSYPTLDLLSLASFTSLNLTDTFGTARALPAADVGAGQHRTLLPLALCHALLQRTSKHQ